METLIYIILICTFFLGLGIGFKTGESVKHDEERFKRNEELKSQLDELIKTKEVLLKLKEQLK